MGRWTQYGLAIEQRKQLSPKTRVKDQTARSRPIKKTSKPIPTLFDMVGYDPLNDSLDDLFRTEASE